MLSYYQDGYSEMRLLCKIRLKAAREAYKIATDNTRSSLLPKFSDCTNSQLYQPLSWLATGMQAGKAHQWRLLKNGQGLF